MLDNQETTKKTKLFGLNTYEAKIWAALLGHGISTAGELSDIANVPRSRSYDVLESLEKKGFVVAKSGKPIRYIPVPPKGVLGNTKKQIEKNTEKHLSEIQSAKFVNLMDAFQDLYEKNVNYTENIVAILHGIKNIYKHISFLSNTNQKDFLFSVENDMEDRSNMLNLIKDKAKKTIKTSISGVRIFVIGDENSMIFPLSIGDVHPDYDLCIWIKNKYITQFLKKLLVSA